MERISNPLNVCDFGVLGDGVTNNTENIAKVIAEAEKMGGGTIYFPPGEYVTGTIELKNDMTMYLDSGAVILGSSNPEDYPMITRKTLPGYNREGHSGLIKAIRAKNVSVIGRGVIDGRGYNWWGNPGNEHRPRAIQTLLCENVLIRGITIKNSAMWTVHPVCCTNVTISDVTIKNPSDSPNTDGINPESCSNVRISNCTIDVGDDCLTLKAGTEDDELQKQYPCENVVITNCTMLNGHGGVVIGSEMSGGVRNVTITNCVFSGTDRGIRIKTRRKRGGSINDVIISNILMDGVLCPFVINGYYQCGGTDPDDMSLFNLDKNPISEYTPVIRNINITNVRAVNARASAAYIYGIPECPVEGLSLTNYSVEMAETEGEPKDKPIMAYHVKKTKGEGIYCANISDSVFRDIKLNVVRGCGIELFKANNVSISGLFIKGSDEPCRITESTNVKVNR